MKLFARPVARVTDPETSHEAANSVYRPSGVAVYIAQLFLQGSMDDETLVMEYEFHADGGHTTSASDQSIRSRRAELVRAGVLRWSGEYALTRRGRRTRIWELTDDYNSNEIDWKLLDLRQNGVRVA